MEQQPSIGRIVHYKSLGSADGSLEPECRAAIVTEVGQVEANEQDPAGDGTQRTTVGLCVMNPTGLFLNRQVLEGDFPGGWHWPERV